MKRKNPDAGRKHKKPPDAVEQGEGANEDDACGAEPAVDQKRQKGGRDEKARAVVGGNKAPTYRDSCRDCQVCLLLACGQGCGGCACECECRTRDARDGVCAVRSRGPRACVCARVQDGDLYCTPDLLSCIAAGCVPCAYKMVVQPSLPQGCEPLRFRANKRPEECLRMR